MCERRFLWLKHVVVLDFKRRINFKQQQKIDRLEQKSKTDGLTTQEKIDLAATKIDNMLRNGDFSTVVYTA